MLEIRKLLYVVLAAVLILGALAVFYLTYRLLFPGTPILKAVYVQEAPKLDGRAGPVWDEAKPLTVRVSNGVDLTMKAVYTDTRLFLLATYEGEKQGGFQSQWIYDGKKWTLGEGQDLFGVFFNKNDSIKGFNEAGFDMMTVPNKAEETKTALTGTTATQKARKLQRRQLAVHQAWPYIVIDKPANDDLAQKGEFWEMSLGVSNVVGKGFAWQFSAWPPLPSLPTGYADPLILEFSQVPSEKTGRPFIANRGGRGDDVAFSAAGRPTYRYKAGKDINNTPYPVLSDMVEIEDPADFKKGERLPYTIFVDDKNTWDDPGYDVDGKAAWSAGVWTIEMGRDLKTEHAWSIVFSPKEDKTVAYHCAVLLRSRAAKPTPKKVSPGPLMILEFQPRQEG